MQIPRMKPNLRVGKNKHSISIRFCIPHNGETASPVVTDSDIFKNKNGFYHLELKTWDWSDDEYRGGCSEVRTTRSWKKLKKHLLECVEGRITATKISALLKVKKIPVSEHRAFYVTIRFGGNEHITQILYGHTEPSEDRHKKMCELLLDKAKTWFEESRDKKLLFHEHSFIRDSTSKAHFRIVVRPMKQTLRGLISRWVLLQSYRPAY